MIMKQCRGCRSPSTNKVLYYVSDGVMTAEGSRALKEEVAAEMVV